MQAKVKNPLSGRYISTDSPTFRKLVNQGYYVKQYVQNFEDHEVSTKNYNKPLNKKYATQEDEYDVQPRRRVGQPTKTNRKTPVAPRRQPVVARASSVVRRAPTIQRPRKLRPEAQTDEETDYESEYDE